jgi:hypothetical protein
LRQLGAPARMHLTGWEPLRGRRLRAIEVVSSYPTRQQSTAGIPNAAQFHILSRSVYFPNLCVFVLMATCGLLVSIASVKDLIGNHSTKAPLTSGFQVLRQDAVVSFPMFRTPSRKDVKF